MTLVILGSLASPRALCCRHRPAVTKVKGMSQHTTVQKHAKQRFRRTPRRPRAAALTAGHAHPPAPDTRHTRRHAEAHHFFTRYFTNIIEKIESLLSSIILTRLRKGATLDSSGWSWAQPPGGSTWCAHHTNLVHPNLANLNNRDRHPFEQATTSAGAVGFGTGTPSSPNLPHSSD